MNTAAKIVLIASILYSIAGATDFDIGLSGSDGGIDGFSLSIGDYYRVPRSELVIIERAIPHDEMSVVYLLSRRAHRDAQFIINLRMRGYSWWDITVRLGLDPYTLYVVDSYRHSAPPYGKAYGYHKEGKHFRLRDDEIVELSNIRFLSKYHHVDADDIIDRHRGGEKYMNINDYYRGKAPQSREIKERRSYENSRRDDVKKHDRRGGEVRIRNGEHKENKQWNKDR